MGAAVWLARPPQLVWAPGDLAHTMVVYQATSTNYAEEAKQPGATSTVVAVAFFYGGQGQVLPSSDDCWAAGRDTKGQRVHSGRTMDTAIAV